MLSIIPKEVLANLTNIHKLLDIGQNLSKNKKNANKNPSVNNKNNSNQANVTNSTNNVQNNSNN